MLRSMKRLILIVASALSILLSGGVAFQPDDREPGGPIAGKGEAPKVDTPDVSKLRLYEVAAVVAGDTLNLRPVSFAKPEEALGIKVRLIGVDVLGTKERKQSEELGKNASAFLSNLLSGERVWLEETEGATKKDGNGRVLGNVFRYPDGLFINLEVVRQGHSYVLTEFPFKHLDAFRWYAAKAKYSKRGLWSEKPKPEPNRNESPAPEPVPVVTPGAVPASTPAAPETKKPDQQTITVYGTRTGSKYHRAGCSYLKSSISMTLEEATRKGLTPCSRCNPPR